MTSTNATTYTIYHHPLSICSIMVRYTLAMRGPPKDDASTMAVTETVVDIINEEQLEEHYLCEVNPKGQVPVLASPSLHKPLPDSLDITSFICERYPRLVPDEHKTEIENLLRDLHKINYFSLTFAGKQARAKSMNTKVQQWLDDPTKKLSDRYRKALEYKIDIVSREKVSALDPGGTERNAEASREFLERIEKLVDPKKGPWLWGSQTPTALDAHLVTFVARLNDIKRSDLVPESVGAYAELAMGGGEWNGVMGDHKSTMPPTAK